jgi:Family of unknown function (DUF6010)
MHAAWDLAHHLWGNPIWPFMPTSSWGCMIFDSLIALWFFAGAPSLWSTKLLNRVKPSGHDVLPHQTELIESKLRKRRSLALARTFSRIAGSGSMRASSVAPIMVEKIAKKARSLSAVRLPGM